MLAGIVALSTAEARAGCHHSWVKQPAVHSTVNELRVLDYGSGPDQSHGESPAQPGPSPCARGACSPAPLIPLSSSEPTSRRAELWGYLSLAVLPSPNPAYAHLPDHDSARSHHRPVRVERPPR
jgi:hypothetical protein